MQRREWRWCTGKSFKETSTGSYPHITQSSPAPGQHALPAHNVSVPTFAVPTSRTPRKQTLANLMFHCPVAPVDFPWATPAPSGPWCSALWLFIHLSLPSSWSGAERITCSGCLSCLTSWLPQLGKHLTILCLLPPLWNRSYRTSVKHLEQSLAHRKCYWLICYYCYNPSSSTPLSPRVWNAFSPHTVSNH